MSEIPPSVEVCHGCGSQEIVRRVEVGVRNEVNLVGLKCKGGFLGPNTEPLYCDICDGCGLVLRFYVTEKRNWVIG